MANPTYTSSTHCSERAPYSPSARHVLFGAALSNIEAISGAFLAETCPCALRPWTG